MAQKKEFRITTPRGSVFTSRDKQYHTLKGNGVGTQMYNALMALPTEPQHEGEE